MLVQTERPKAAHNESFKPTANAWHFWFAVNLVFKA